VANEVNDLVYEGYLKAFAVVKSGDKLTGPWVHGIINETQNLNVGEKAQMAAALAIGAEHAHGVGLRDRRDVSRRIADLLGTQ
jgi:hypothetical protein